MTAKISLDAITKAPRFTAKCGEEFEVQVQYSVPVRDCANPSEEEQGKMIRGLQFELQQKALTACAENEDCPWFTVVNGDNIEQICGPNNQGVNVWTSKWNFTVKCMA